MDNLTNDCPWQDPFRPSVRSLHDETEIERNVALRDKAWAKGPFPHPWNVRETTETEKHSIDVRAFVNEKPPIEFASHIRPEIKPWPE